MGVLPLDTLIPVVRLHVYEVMAVEGYDLVDAAYIADAVDADVTASYVKMAFRQLVLSKEIEHEVKRNSISGDVITDKVFITAKGVRAVEKELQDEESVTSRYQRSGADGSDISYLKSAFAPASDRLVAFSDNEPAALKAREAVDRLKDKLIQSNDVPAELLPFKEVVVNEVGILSQLINQTAVRASIVISFARKLLPWLMDKASGAAIGELAKRALAALIDWLT